jgi:hypothetical protein
MEEVKFLESIGAAQMEQELQKRVLTIAKKSSENMTQETGVQPSLSENDMKQYLMKYKKSKFGRHDFIIKTKYYPCKLVFSSLFDTFYKCSITCPQIEECS